jgi:phosphomannomutase
MTLTCFKAYDVRGRIGHDLDEGVAARIARGIVAVLRPARVVLGRDGRASSPALSDAMAQAFSGAGVAVSDIGQAGTEEVYFATAHLGADAGIEVTASHNPIDYNGMKIVGPGSRPLSDAEFAAIRAAAEADSGPNGPGSAPVELVDTRPAYAAHVAGFVDAGALKPLKVVVNAGNGVAGAAFDAIRSVLAARGARLDVIRLHHAPDPTFPNGIPNPLLPENRPVTAEAVRAAGADMGVAWDGDFDRCFLFDERGDFVDGEHVVGLLAAAMLARHPGAAIVHDPRVMWNTQAVVGAAGGRAVVTKTGHAHLKRAMREADAVYGGEMSAHHYFRDFFFCDTGMVPWLLIAAHMSETGLALSDLVGGMRAAFPTSGERNYRVSDAAVVRDRVLAHFEPSMPEIDRLDGLSLSFSNWRLNLRSSSTEPLLRLNIETRGDRALLAAKLAEVEALIAE